jgi:hypothetical protein
VQGAVTRVPPELSVDPVDGFSAGAFTRSAGSASRWRTRNTGSFQARLKPPLAASTSSMNASGVRTGNRGRVWAEMSVRDPSGK